MKKMKKTKIVFGAILAAMMLVSTATAVQQVNSEPVMDYIAGDTIEETNLEEFIRYYCELSSTTILSKQSEPVTPGSASTYIDPREVMDFIISFFESPELLSYYESSEFDTIEGPLMSMITDWEDIETLADDLVTISNSDEFDILVNDIKDLLEDTPFIQNMYWYEEIQALLDEIANMIGFAIAIMLCPITILLGCNGLSYSLVFPLALILALIPAMCLGALIAIPWCVLDAQEYLGEAMEIILTLLQTHSNPYWGLLGIVLAVCAIPVVLILAAIIFMIAYIPYWGIGTIGYGATIAEYVLEYLLLINEHLFGDGDGENLNLYTTPQSDSTNN
jgi:hypothetical protein